MSARSTIVLFALLSTVSLVFLQSCASQTLPDEVDAQAGSLVNVATESIATSAEALRQDLPACLNLEQRRTEVFPPGFPNFGDELCSGIPLDAYDSANFTNQKPSNLDEPINYADWEKRVNLHRLYDIFAWQTFLAINWPVNEQGGEPAEDISALGYSTYVESAECGDSANASVEVDNMLVPRWATWKERFEIFLEDGSKPTEWGSPRSAQPINTPPFEHIPTDVRTRILNEADQAESGLPLWDQNGNLVHYEVLMNRNLFRDIVINELYNIQGQIKFFQDDMDKTGVWFDYGKINQNDLGDISIKLAWKMIDEEAGDVAERYFTTGACVLDRETKQWQHEKVGLVGMHMSHKTLSSQNWVWMTFEHVDNLHINELDALAYAREGKILKPSFYDPFCPTCAANVEPPAARARETRKTQVTRILPISDSTAQLNKEVHGLLKESESVWQFYELIGAQYARNSTLSSTGPGGGSIREQITNKSGGYPLPTFLTNTVIDTYTQGGNQEAGLLLSDGRSPFTNNTKEVVFGTTSCMACHRSARLAVAESPTANGKTPFYLSKSGDFLFSLEEARWKR